MSKFNKILDEKIHETFSDFMIERLQNTQKSIAVLHDILSTFNINYTILGGIAVEEYGYVRSTEDIDILVDLDDKEKLLNIPPGFMKQSTDRTMWLHDPRVKVEVWYSGDISGNKKGIPYVNPKLISELHHGIPVLRLCALIAYKLSAGKYGTNRKHKDYADIVQLIIKHKLPRDYGTIHNYRQDLNDEYKAIYDDIEK